MVVQFLISPVIYNDLIQLLLCWNFVFFIHFKNTELVVGVDVCLVEELPVEGMVAALLLGEYLDAAQVRLKYFLDDFLLS